MTINGKQIINNAVGAAEKLGMAGLHAIAPDNYEYYMCSLELLDMNKNQKGFITFPVMPNNISESRSPIQSQIKTKSGIVTVFNDSFSPINISFSGTFGRKLRIVSGITEPSDDKWGNFFNGTIGSASWLPNGVKTGYGLIKLMEKIIDKANELDENGYPYILIFNNYSFNSSYVVDVISRSFNQGVENNMMWFYSVQLKAVAPSTAIRTTDSSNWKMMLKGVAANGIAQVLNGLINNAVVNNLY